jgi:putative oxidoreductase
MDFGLLVIRLVLGLTLAAHGAQKLFGVFGGHGLKGTGAFLESLGFRPGRRHAEIAGVVELAAGLGIALGMLTPFASAAAIGVMIVAALAVHRNSFFVTSGGFEYAFVVAGVATGLAFTGPGFVSIDRFLDLDLRGTAWGVLALALGGAAAAAQLSLRNSDVDEADIDLRDDADLAVK